MPRPSVFGVANSAGSTGTVSSFTADTPPEVRAGQPGADGKLLLVTLVSNNVASQATPTGWNPWQVEGTTGHSQNTFWRITSSEPASYTFTGLTSARWGGFMRAYADADTTTPKDVASPTRTAGTTGLT